MVTGLWRKDEDDYSIFFLEILVSGGFIMGSVFFSFKFLGVNMVKGMFKLVRVIWRDIGGSISVRVFFSLRVFVDVVRSLEV